MNFLKKELAPLTQKAWDEIEEQARVTLNNNLTARKFISIAEAKGWNFSGLPTGRIAAIQKKNNLNFGIREFMPAVEVRNEFELDIWEMDNADRGAADIDLEPLEKAAEATAKFEDEIIYNGLSEANIDGLKKSAEHSLPVGKDNWADLISNAIIKMKNAAIKPPYALILGEEYWKKLISEVKGYPIKRHIENLIEGPIIETSAINDGLLVQFKSDDILLTPGQDLSIGYQNHDEKKVKLFITETFTFSIFEPKAILHFRKS